MVSSLKWRASCETERMSLSRLQSFAPVRQLSKIGSPLGARRKAVANGATAFWRPAQKGRSPIASAKGVVVEDDYATSAKTLGPVLAGVDDAHKLDRYKHGAQDVTQNHQHQSTGYL